MTTEGNVITGSKEILQEVEKQYEILFRSEPISAEMLRLFLEQEGFPKLSDEDKNLLEHPFSKKEVKEAIHSFDGKKTPVGDGLPVELYWAHADVIALILTHLFNNYGECMLPSSYAGVLTLLYKGKGERCLRENWRPLTMMNLDYKIYAKCISRRLQKIIGKLVHFDQTCSVPGRKIQDSILHVLNVIAFAEEHNLEAMILSIDHESAFDTVEWSFMFQTLEAMNFGPTFINFIKAIYREGNTCSSVVVNGFLSEPFKVHRGLRQGCPLSPLLYVILMEVSAHYMRKTGELQGIPLCGLNTKLTKYADDTSIFVRSFEEIDSVLSIFRLFKTASGSRLKEAKTQLLYLGAFKNLTREDTPSRFRAYVKENLKLYGVTLHASKDAASEANWEKPRKQIDTLKKRLAPYGVSLFGKIHFVNTYFLCMFWYITNILTAPKQLQRDAYNAIDRLLWLPSKINLIKKDILFLPVNKGGIGYPNIDVRAKANRLMFLVRRITHKEALSWFSAFDHFYRRVESKRLFELEHVSVPIFYKEVRAAEIYSKFRREGVFCWVFEKKIALNAVTPKYLYDSWIIYNFLKSIEGNELFWAGKLGVSRSFVSVSWDYAKARFVDGAARNLHYRLRHKSLYTRHRTTHFSDNPIYCKFCMSEGNLVVEDNLHLILYCPRAYNFFSEITPLLSRISDFRYLELPHLVLGVRLQDKKRQGVFNFVLQHAQLAIWKSRGNLENNLDDIDCMEIFKRNVFRNLCRVKATMRYDAFFDYFDRLVRPTKTISGFCLTTT